VILWSDIETFSEIPLKHGVHRYVEGNAEILLYQYAIDDGPVHVVDWTQEHELEQMEIAELTARADEVVFHKADFDRNVLAALEPELAPALHKTRCTYTQAMAHSLPGGLEKLCSILNVPLGERKHAGGKDLIRLFCKPLPKNMKLRRATRETHPGEWQQFVEYGGADILAMRAIRRVMPVWNYAGAELDLWHLDQRINCRGLPVDVDFAHAAIRTAERVQKRLAEEAADITSGQVASTRQRDKLLAYLLAEHGVGLPDLKGDTVERRIDDPDLPWQVRALLVNRLEATRASTAKYKALLRSVSADGRLRGTMQFAGALRTARWAGRIFQPHNLMRTPKYLAGDDEVAFAQDVIASDAADLFFDKPLEVLAAGVPWVICAPKKKKFVAPDLSNIEGRSLAWLAGEEWKLKAFRDADADPKNKAKDLYILGYAKSFSESVEQVVADYIAGGKKRQIGKVQELALGYQGAVGAFVSMSAVYRIDLDELAIALPTMPEAVRAKAAKAYDEAFADGRSFDLAPEVYQVCHCFVQLWRGACPRTVQFWWDLQDATRDAIRNPGEIFRVGPQRIAIRRDGNWMRARLPSGRFLCYPAPKVDPATGKIQYKGVNQYNRRWSTIETYGGKLAENITQAVARDVLAAAMPPAEEAGYEIVFHVHDELVAEVPDTDEYSSDELGEILATNPPWAAGLPLAVGGYETYRYRKD
jgi:DNA polymerase